MKKNLTIILGFVAVIVIVTIFFLGHTASGQLLRKDFTSQFNKGLRREITVYNANGKIIYENKGKFDVDYKDGRLQYVDQKNLKHNIYIGYNATVIVDELE